MQVEMGQNFSLESMNASEDGAKFFFFGKFEGRRIENILGEGGNGWWVSVCSG